MSWGGVFNADCTPCMSHGCKNSNDDSVLQEWVSLNMFPSTYHLLLWTYSAPPNGKPHCVYDVIRLRPTLTRAQKTDFHNQLCRRATMLIVFVTHGYCLYIKGTSEILTKLCRWHVVVHQQGGPTDCGDIEFAEIDDFSEGNITRTIIFYANQTASKPRWTMVDEVCIFGVAVRRNSFVAGAI